MRHLTTLLALLATPLAAQEPPQDTENAAAYGGRAAGVNEQVEATGGEEIYRSLCQGCHQPDGSGAEGAGHYPALAGNETLAYPEYAITIVLNGQKAMPPLGDILDDEQVAAVVRYVQGAWGNIAEAEADAAMVGDFRPAEPEADD